MGTGGVRTAGAVALALAVAATAAGCSGGGGRSQASGTTASSSTAPGTVPAGTLEASGLAAGQTWTSTVGDTATYYSSTASDRRTTVDAGFCAAAGGTAAAVSSYSWALVARDGRLYRPVAPAAATPSPAYPDTKLVTPGQCLRGWVSFALPAGAQAVRVAYQPEGTAAPLATWNP